MRSESESDNRLTEFHNSSIDLAEFRIKFENKSKLVYPSINFDARIVSIGPSNPHPVMSRAQTTFLFPITNEPAVVLP